MLPGYQRRPCHMVFADFYPTNSGDFEQAARRRSSTLSLSDSSFSFEPVTSEALGFGFRCGFLGLLHMEIVQQRLEREHDVDMIQTAPTVTYPGRDAGRRAATRSTRPANCPEPDKFEQPARGADRPGVNMLIPSDYIGADDADRQRAPGHVRTPGIPLHDARATARSTTCPLAEIIYDFYDKLKSATRGYGTLNYELVTGLLQPRTTWSSCASW